MENLRTLYYLIKKWEKEMQNLSNPQVVAATQKMITKAKKDYKFPCSAIATNSL